MPRERIAALQNARRVEHARECTLARVGLAELNALGEREFVALLGGVFEHSPWVAQRAFAARPFSSIDGLHKAMMSSVGAAGRQEQLALLRAHPELAGAEAGTRSLTADSSSEQAHLGFTSLSKAELSRMAELNRRYREKHGFPCIVALRLHATRESVMQEMQQRLENTTQAELRNALEQIGHITRGRLDKWAS
jgi:2-oxo-4-hydroxy-4-carboxy-5-ureidoimidazoline decarboxylase